MMKKNLVLILLCLLSTGTYAQLPVEVIPPEEQAAWLESPDPVLAMNKKVVYDFWRYALVAHDMEEAAKLMTESYIQHNPNVPTGRAPFLQFFGSLPQVEPIDYIDNLVSIMAEKDYVTMSIQVVLPNPNEPGETYTTTWFDMYRLEDGLIAEHWDYGTLEPR